ncbi:hypothetical protein EC988_008321, partial [Linderina pennispora]
MLTWIPAASAPSSWFTKNKGLATGITHMGLGIGGLVFSPLTRFLLERTGTSGSLRWLSLVALIGVTLASLGVHSKKHERVSDLVISSVRWSKRLESEFECLPEDGFDSDQEIDYPQYCRQSRMLLCGDTMRDSEEGGGGAILPSEGEISEALEPKFSTPRPAKIHHDDTAVGIDDLDADASSSSSEDEDLLAAKGKAARFADEGPARPRPVKQVRFSPSTLKLLTLERLEGTWGSSPTDLMSRRKRANERARVRRNRQRAARAMAKRISMPSMAKRAAPEPHGAARSVLQSWRFWFLSLGVGLGQAG